MSREGCVSRGACPAIQALSFSEKLIMNNKDIQVLFKLSKFCKDILATFKVIHSNI